MPSLLLPDEISHHHCCHTSTSFSALNPLSDFSPRKAGPSCPCLNTWQDTQKSRSKFLLHVIKLAGTRSLYIVKFADKTDKVSPNLWGSPIVTCVKVGHLSPFCTSVKTPIKEPLLLIQKMTLLHDLSAEHKESTYKYIHNTMFFACVYVLHICFWVKPKQIFVEIKQMFSWFTRDKPQKQVALGPT